MAISRRGSVLIIGLVIVIAWISVAQFGFLEGSRTSTQMNTISSTYVSPIPISYSTYTSGNLTETVTIPPSISFQTTTRSTSIFTYQAIPTNSLNETYPMLFTGDSDMVSIIQSILTNFTRAYPNIPTDFPTGGCAGCGHETSDPTNQISLADAPLRQQLVELYPNVLQIPIFISASEFIYNIPGLPETVHLNLTGSILAQIYNGSISYWDDPQITTINPAAISYLHHEQIVPLRRADGTGETLTVTEYLANSSRWWNATVGYGTTVSWPSVSTGVVEYGDGGVLEGCQMTNYSIGYLSSSYFVAKRSSNVSYAYLQNYKGDFVNITASSVSSFTYPLVNYDYAFVSKLQNSVTYDYNVRTFLSWLLTTTQEENQAVAFNSFGNVPLSQGVFLSSLSLINDIN